MDWTAFVAMAERANIRPRQRWRTPYCDILIGDRISYTDGNDGISRIPLIETLWFLNHDGPQVGRAIRYCSFFDKDGSYITPETRYAEALEDALGFLSSFVQSGGFGQQGIPYEQAKLIPWNVDHYRQVVTGGMMNGGLHG